MSRRGRADRDDGTSVPRVELTGIHREGTALRYEFECSPGLRRFFTGEDLVIEYDADVGEVPEHVLAIPWLANVCPVAWSRRADVYVPRIDAAFRDALFSVQHTLSRMYPRVIRGGDLYYREALGDGTGSDDSARSAEPGAGAPAEAGAGGRSALLFSGGVDSLASYLRHREEDPLLITIQGWDVTLDRAAEWAELRDALSRFGDDHGLENRFVRSNVLSVVDRLMLLSHYKRYVGEDWYTGVGHGLGLLGLCAPLAHRAGVDTLYIAATHAEGFPHPWGSHPDIDGRVRWRGTEVVHDCYDLTRQEKLERIAAHVRESEPDLTIRSCYEPGAGNCGRCEKCCRTAVGLLLAGLDPADHGYDVGPDLFAYVGKRFESGDWTFGPDERFMWRDLQAHVPADPDFDYPGANDFFRWLRGADVERLVDTAPPVSQRMVHAVARNTPYALYSPLYSAYEAVQGRRGSG